MGRCVFPFVAVIGQERIKRALILNVVNPCIGGVLIAGEKGTAKSTLVRGLADVINGMKVIELPLNITEDRLVGSIDIEAAVAQGRKCLELGVLQKADGNILYIDEVNLLSEHIANCLLETAASGVNIIEREGISCRHMARFVLVGTMNPEEGGLRPQLLDRFGLYVVVHGEADRGNRAEIIRRRLDFERDPAAYQRQWQKESQALAERIERAKKSLPGVQVSPANLSLAAAVARQANCAGHRAEIIIIQTAMAIAALNGRQTITEDHIREAAGYVLPHRLREPIPNCNANAEDEPEKPVDVRNEDEAPAPDNPVATPGTNESGANDVIEPYLRNDMQNAPLERENLEEPSGIFDARITANMQFNKLKHPRGSGKRARVKSDSRQGRYIKFKLPEGKARDMAFDATLRAAAPSQRTRKEPGLAVVIKPPDIREKVKERHTGCIVLFVVDASGSMGARRRMGAVKGAVMSLLRDAYRKRDRIGIVTFRKNSATLLLGITRSIELAHKCLKELPTGGRTPLAAGLYKAYEILKTARIKEPEVLPYVVLVSDGKANVALNGCSAIEDALMVAAKLRAEGIHSMVLDTEEGYFRLGLAKKIAEVLDAMYVKMDDISVRGITSNVRQLVA